MESNQMTYGCLPCPTKETSRPVYVSKDETTKLYLVQRLLKNGTTKTYSKQYKTYAGASNRAYHYNLGLKERGEL